MCIVIADFFLTLVLFNHYSPINFLIMFNSRKQPQTLTPEQAETVRKSLKNNRLPAKTEIEIGLQEWEEKDSDLEDFVSGLYGNVNISED